MWFGSPIVHGSHLPHAGFILLVLLPGKDASNPEEFSSQRKDWEESLIWFEYWFTNGKKRKAKGTIGIYFE